MLVPADCEVAWGTSRSSLLTMRMRGRTNGLPALCEISQQARFGIAARHPILATLIVHILVSEAFGTMAC